MAKAITFAQAHQVQGQVLESLTDEAWYSCTISKNEVRLQGRNSPKLAKKIMAKYNKDATVSASTGYVEFNFKYDGIQVNITLT
jgi:translation initiation factor 1 (eIF-1/SUI1)